jgi:hypothetical protein
VVNVLYFRGFVGSPSEGAIYLDRWREVTSRSLGAKALLVKEEYFFWE